MISSICKAILLAVLLLTGLAVSGVVTIHPGAVQNLRSLRAAPQSEAKLVQDELDELAVVRRQNLRRLKAAVLEAQGRSHDESTLAHKIIEKQEASAEELTQLTQAARVLRGGLAEVSAVGSKTQRTAASSSITSVCACQPECVEVQWRRACQR